MLAVNQTESLFFDKAQTHTLSDWLIPAVFEREQKTNEEYVLGLPDLSDLIDRESGSVQVNWPLWRELVSSRLTPIGQRLKALAQDKDFYDLACGDPSLSVAPRLIAQSFGAQSYVGVDLKNVDNRILQEEFPALGNFVQRRVRMDALSFLKDQILLSPACILISGLEAVREDDAITKQYLHGLSFEIERKTQRGDILILGAGTSEMKFSPKAFRSIYSDHYHEVFERRGRPLFFQ
jgi:hypothetical protein